MEIYLLPMEKVSRAPTVPLPFLLARSRLTSTRAWQTQQSWRAIGVARHAGSLVSLAGLNRPIIV